MVRKPEARRGIYEPIEVSLELIRIFQHLRKEFICLGF
jgi:hypothetical protein